MSSASVAPGSEPRAVPAAPAPATRWQVFRILCAILRRVLEPEQPVRAPAEGAIRWGTIVEAASHHFVSPSLGWALKDEPSLPAELVDYCDAVLQLNRDRNAQFFDTLEIALRALNAAGIAPALLKGGASLVSGLYPDPGMRVLGDLDLLVPRAERDHAAAVLEAAGFACPVRPKRWFEAEAHQLPRQHHRDTGVGMELHTAVVPSPFTAIIDAGAFLAGAAPAEFRGQACLIPNPTDRVVHNAVHTQLCDQHHALQSVELRQLLEFALLCARYADRVDWERAEHQFAAAGRAHVLREMLQLAAALFDRPIGNCAPAEGHTARDRLEAGFERPKQVSWRWIAGQYATFLFENPLNLLNVLQPRSWPSRLYMLRKLRGVQRW